MTTMTRPRTHTHLALRIPMTGRPLRWIVERHTDILEQHGSVWLGIQTRAVAARFITEMAEQKHHGTPTFLYLLQRHDDLFFGCKGQIVNAQNIFETAMRVPDYYSKDMIKSMKGWVELASLVPVSGSELEALVLATSGSNLLFVLSKSMLSFCEVVVGR